MTEPRRITDQYRLDKLLHSSSSGSVFRATELETGGTVVVKLIVGDDSAADFEEQLSRFLTAAAALRELGHPAIPRILDFGLTSAGSAFLVLELLPGMASLETLIGSRPARLVPLLTQVISGLEALESKGVAHRNLTAANILMAPGLEEVQVKLLGLGHIAADPEPRRTDLPAFGLLVCRMLGVTPPVDPKAAELRLPARLEDEARGPELLRALLEMLLRPARQEDALPSYEEIRRTLAESLASAPDSDRTIILPASAELPAPVAPLPEAPPQLLPVATVPIHVPPALLIPPPTEPASPPPEPIAPPAPPVPPVPPLLTVPPPVPPSATLSIPLKKRRPSRLLLVGGGLLALLLVAATAALFVGQRFESQHAAVKKPAPVQAATPEPAPPPEAVVEETPAETPDPAVPEADRPAALAASLASAVRSGDIRKLRAAVAGINALTPEERQGLSTKAARDLDTAGRALAAEANLTAAEKAGKPEDILAQAAELAKLLLASARVRTVRDKAAGALETEADQALEAGRYDEALRSLEAVRRTWPERAGLDDRLRAVQSARSEEEEMGSILAQAEKAGRSHEGLKLLAGAAPTPRYADRFRQVRAGLEAQLTRQDQEAPTVTLVGTPPQVEKGKSVRLVLRFQDDYEVTDATLFVRREGARFEKLTLRPLTATDYEAQVPADFHKNDALDLYAIATDRSGHTGRLASPEAPLKLKKKGFFQRVLGRDDG